jgi:hypothetical protein
MPAGSTLAQQILVVYSGSIPLIILTFIILAVVAEVRSSCCGAAGKQRR